MDGLSGMLGTPLQSRSEVRGAVSVWRPAPGVFVTRVVGYLDVMGATEIETCFRKQVAEDGRHIGFHDWRAMSDYDSRARILLTDATYRLLPRIEAAHFLIQSRIVAFGVHAANLVLRRLTVHSVPDDFAYELQRAIARHSSRPPTSPPSSGRQ